MRPSQTASLLSFLIAMVGLLAYNALAAALTGSAAVLGDVGYYTLTFLIQAALFALPAALYYRHYPRHRPALRLSEKLHPESILLLITSAVIGVFLSSFLTSFWMMLLRSLSLVPTGQTSAVPRTALQLLYMLITSAVAPALFEEVLFRGFLLPSMEPAGRRWAIFISGSMFALLHGRIEALPAHMLLGITLSMLVLNTESLRAAMLYHATHNAVIMLTAFISGISEAPDVVSVDLAVSQTFLFVPVMLLIAFAWAFVLSKVIQNAKRHIVAPLAPARHAALPTIPAILLSACSILLLVMTFTELLWMLPRYLP